MTPAELKTLRAIKRAAVKLVDLIENGEVACVCDGNINGRDFLAGEMHDRWCPVRRMRDLLGRPVR